MGSTVRDARLSGHAAAEWLRTRSLLPAGEAERTMLFADEVDSDDFIARRFWTNQSALHWSLSGSGRQSAVALIIEGRGRVGGHTAEPGAVVLLEAGSEIDLRFETPMAIAQLLTPRERLPTIPENAPSSGFWVGDPGFGPFLLSSVMSLLSERIDVDQEGFEYARRSAEMAASAVIASVSEASPAGTSAERLLFSRGADLIRTRAHETELTVDRIVRLLNSSKSNVHRAFEAAGTSPGRMLRATRAQLASTLLSDRLVTSKAEAEEIARAAGFRSSRSMRAAIAEENDLLEEAGLDGPAPARGDDA